MLLFFYACIMIHMKSILVDYKSITPRFDELSLCLGYFDAVHIGHQNLIKYARKNAKYTLGLLTFNKPISTLVDNGKSKDVITSLDDRFKIISNRLNFPHCRRRFFDAMPKKPIARLLYSILRICYKVNTFL